MTTADRIRAELQREQSRTRLAAAYRAERTADFFRAQDERAEQPDTDWQDARHRMGAVVWLVIALAIAACIGAYFVAQWLRVGP